MFKQRLPLANDARHHDTAGDQALRMMPACSRGALSSNFEPQKQITCTWRLARGSKDAETACCTHVHDQCMHRQVLCLRAQVAILLHGSTIGTLSQKYKQRLANRLTETSDIMPRRCCHFMLVVNWTTQA